MLWGWVVVAVVSGVGRMMSRMRGMMMNRMRRMRWGIVARWVPVTGCLLFTVSSGRFAAFALVRMESSRPAVRVLALTGVILVARPLAPAALRDTDSPVSHFADFLDGEPADAVLGARSIAFAVLIASCGGLGSTRAILNGSLPDFDPFVGNRVRNRSLMVLAEFFVPQWRYLGIEFDTGSDVRP